MKVPGKDLHILIDRPVLDYTTIQLGHMKVRLKSFVEEIDLKIKTPSLHIGIKIAQIWIIGNGFIKGLPALSLRQNPCESGFPHPDIARQTNERTKSHSFCMHGEKIQEIKKPFKKGLFYYKVLSVSRIHIPMKYLHRSTMLHPLLSSGQGFLFPSIESQ